MVSTILNYDAMVLPVVIGVCITLILAARDAVRRHGVSARDCVSCGANDSLRRVRLDPDVEEWSCLHCGHSAGSEME